MTLALRVHMNIIEMQLVYIIYHDNEPALIKYINWIGVKITWWNILPVNKMAAHWFLILRQAMI